MEIQIVVTSAYGAGLCRQAEAVTISICAAAIHNTRLIRVCSSEPHGGLSTIAK